LKRRTWCLTFLYVLAHMMAPPIIPAESGAGLRGSYYLNAEFAGEPALTRIDATVDFKLTNTGSTVFAPASRFSTRWLGQVEAPITGAYVFAVQADGPIRLWIGGKLIIDRWAGIGRTEATPVELTSGQRYDIRLEYLGSLGGAAIQLLWTYPNQTEQVIPKGRLHPGAGNVGTSP
jgi:hypothetical protein